MNTAGSIYDASASPPPTAPSVVAGGSAGAISGGVLRPGSIDQGAFLQALQQAQQNREAAGVGGKPVAMPVQSFQSSNIPTLTSAQFAALVGGQSDDPPLADPDNGAAADPQAEAQGLTGTVAAAAAPTAAPTATATKLNGMKLSGRPAETPATPASQAGADTADEAAPTFTRIGEPKLLDSAATPAAAGGTAASDADPKAADAASQAAAKDAGKTDAGKTGAEKTPPADPDVVHLKDAPDRETQRNLMAQHKRWVVDETPGARQLFFGADGVFGWDDFLDVINPLQHIPIVAQIYRAVTGDEINGAAELLGSLPLGPLGVIGTMGTVADLAVKDTTGKDIGENLEALVFGSGTKSGDGAAGDASDMAEATPAHPDLDMQTASAAPAVSGMDAARQAHDQRRA